MGNVNNIVNSSANEWKGAKSYANKVLTYFDEYGGAVQASTAKATKAIDGFSGTITSTYGTRTRNGKTETHKGIDIAGNKGDKIGATTAGTVTYAGWGKAGTGYGNYGNVVAVTAADGKTYLYAHLDSTKVKKGDKVGVNQTIGTMGNTGDSDGVHLHYEVRTGGYGTDIDPMSSVQDARSAFSGDAADRAAAIDNAKSEVLSMQQEALQIQDQIQELNMNLIESVQAGFDRVRDSYNDDLARIDLVQASLAETDKKWIDQQLKKESIVRKQLEQDKKAINYTKDQIKNNKALTDAQKALLEDDLLQRTQDMISLEQQLLEERTSMADSIIDSYKQAAEAIKDAQTQAIDDMIDEINKADDEAEYTKQLEEAQKNRQELLDEIAKRSLDDSYESQSKIADLQEQLDEQNESITDMQSDRAKEQRIDNLNEQKETIQSNYENLVNDERKFARMRSDIINGNTKQIQKDLDKYYTNVKSNTGLLGKAISNNLIDLINQANRYLNGKDYKPIKIASAKEGGITPGWGSSGKLMMLHENEMISTEHDTKNLLAAMEKSSKLTDVLKSLDIGKTLANASMNLLTNFKIPSMPTLNPVTSTVGDTYHNTIQVRIDASNTTRQQARDIGTELVNNLKLQGIKMK
ncbi:peptidoglycan DD-metalloendopeptidase family protein [Bacillus sp. Au-Bac7]|nr:peptidoglycan DD-metalloendopeptidase family protein [Bacillus sp. Au-Bac7]